MGDINVFPDPTDLVGEMALQIISLGNGAIAERGHYSFMLSGGSTPRLLYERLAEPDVLGDLDWTKVGVYWGDERCVPPDHRDSNYRMARETLLEHVPIPLENIHRIRGERDPQTGALLYEAEVRESFQGEQGAFYTANTTKGFLPVFDVVLLGLGTDGHTASLFPDSNALKEKERWFVAVEHNQPPPPLVARITVTPIVINAAANVFFLVTGADKAKRLFQVLEGTYRPEELPAQMINPGKGRLSWFLDQAAASDLSVG